MIERYVVLYLDGENLSDIRAFSKVEFVGKTEEECTDFLRRETEDEEAEFDSDGAYLDGCTTVYKMQKITID